MKISWATFAFAISCASPPAGDGPDASATDTGAATATEGTASLPTHNECVAPGQEMSPEVCAAVVEADGRLPTVSYNQDHTEPDPNDPRLTDPEYLWLGAEVRRCTCVCCHSTIIGGPGAHRWDIEWQPVWIDSASDWALTVFAGYTDEYLQTLPTDDPERLHAVIDRELARRDQQ